MPHSDPKGNVRSIDGAIPEELKKKRDEIRAMMKHRCELPDSPIPPGLALRTADFIFVLTLIRCNVRIAKGRRPFPDAETLANDIARAAESVETVCVVMTEEALETLEGIPAILRAP